jgi:hypothetical protein
MSAKENNNTPEEALMINDKRRATHKLRKSNKFKKNRKNKTRKYKHKRN